MSTIANLTIHCRDAEALSAFWATALGWNRETADGSATLTDPDARHSAWYLENVSDPGAAHGRWHVDLAAQGDHDGEVARLVAAGATEVRQHDSWTVLADPEGNHFCALR